MNYELSIKIIDKKYLDSLIVSLVHQGYDTYYNSNEDAVCMTISDSDLIKITRIG